jgi:enamine deaminase RidA (YjgF/YER057c/UK114 family)
MATRTDHFQQGREFGKNLLYMSGVGPEMKDGKFTYIGRVGEEFTVEQGAAAARSTGIMMLSALHAVTGDLNRVKCIVKVLGFVSSAPGFYQQPAVMNGFSDLMVEVFGWDVASHARSAIGTSVLPSNIPVEVEMLVELKE